jgi:hypothetical protein
MLRRTVNLLAVSGASVLGMRARSPRLLNAVLPIEVAAGYLLADGRRFHRLFGVDQCLRVRRVEPQGAAVGQPRR